MVLGGGEAMQLSFLFQLCYIESLARGCAVWMFIERRGIEILADKYSRQHSNNMRRSI